jgi:hypothetical protein
MTECRTCKKTFKNVALHFNKVHSDYCLIITAVNPNEPPKITAWIENYDGTSESACDLFANNESEHQAMYDVEVFGKDTRFLINYETFEVHFWRYVSSGTEVINKKRIATEVKNEVEAATQD